MIENADFATILGVLPILEKQNQLEEANTYSSGFTRGGYSFWQSPPPILGKTEVAMGMMPSDAIFGNSLQLFMFRRGVNDDRWVQLLKSQVRSRLPSS